MQILEHKFVYMKTNSCVYNQKTKKLKEKC